MYRVRLMKSWASEPGLVLFIRHCYYDFNSHCLKLQHQLWPTLAEDHDLNII